MDYKTNIQIDQVAITVFGGVKLKHVLIKDQHNDTLISVNRISTNILSYKKLTSGDLIFGDVNMDALFLNMKTYKGETDTNLDKFIAAFDDGKPASGKFLLQAKSVKVAQSRFLFWDENRGVKDVDFTNLNASVSDFQIHGPNVTTQIERMSFLDHRGLFVKNLVSNFTYTKKHILLNDLDLTTNHSLFKGNVALNYIREDFHDFNNKVHFDILVDQASLSTNDIRCFYDEIGKDQNFTLKAHITGTLNDLVAHKLRLTDNNRSQIIGNVNFKNLFGKNEQHFYMKGDFQKVASDYDHLVKLLPNILGKKLPTSLKKIGSFDWRGQTEITTKTIAADFYMTTALGNIQSNLKMSAIDNIDNATYTGNIIL